jgi:hypothetical protein
MSDCDCTVDPFDTLTDLAAIDGQRICNRFQIFAGVDGWRVCQVDYCGRFEVAMFECVYLQAAVNCACTLNAAERTLTQ